MSTPPFSVKSVIVIGILGGVIFQLINVVRRALVTPLRRIPGPWYAPWTNLVLKFHVLGGKRSQYIHSLHERYGTFVRITPTEVSVSDLPSVHKVHRVGSKFTKAKWYQKFNTNELYGIFAMIDPKDHAARRRLFASNFSNSFLGQFEGRIRQKVEMAAAKIRRDALQGKADIFMWFTFLATDVMGELSIGKSFEMLQLEKKTPDIHDVETTMIIGGIRAEVGPLLWIAQWIPIKTIQDFLNLSHRLDQYGLQAIENHRERLKEVKDRDSASLFSKFLDPSKNQELTLPQISIEVANLIVAGSDTTAVTLTYLVWSVLRPQHRAIKEKLLAEISTVPENASAAEIAKLPYLQAVISETLRLYGAAPGSLPRETPAEGAQLGEYFIPGGTIVSVQAYTLHRDPASFANPEKFMPERWLEPNDRMKEAFLPYGAGSRICLGIHLATMELLLATFVFFKTCPDVTLAASTTDESMEIENYFLIAPKAHRCEIMAAS